MRSSAVILALLAASAVASPIKVITDVVYVTQTFVAGADQNAPQTHHHTRSHHAVITTITGDAPEPTPVQQDQQPPPPPDNSPAPAPSPQSSPASYTPSGDYSTNCVNAHNVHRSNHSVGPVSWDDGLASIAAQIASTCVWGHDTNAGGGGYGQNIAAGYGPGDVAKVISDLWYNNEVGCYPQYGVPTPDMGNFENWGHFSQMVWKDTTLIGCATQSCPGGLSGLGSGVGPYFTVCNYRNTGNVKEYFGANVLPSLGNPTVTG
ncbi:hypothetical protein GP486_006162 [Trichoglossum hirsutum]|uniref:SCP domain-containing protein n=1 Tax=Trichoglossum hirsutum TaxID=265104 RepID=A0A9P8L7V5_9PEZI|nr:hypothetical protein GP486_006162 [Trichoglossum hirsutum]